MRGWMVVLAMILLLEAEGRSAQLRTSSTEYLPLTALTGMLNPKNEKYQFDKLSPKADSFCCLSFTDSLANKNCLFCHVIVIIRHYFVFVVLKEIRST
jgi:hypothetical protein